MFKWLIKIIRQWEKEIDMEFWCLTDKQWKDWKGSLPRYKCIKDNVTTTIKYKVCNKTYKDLIVNTE